VTEIAVGNAHDPSAPSARASPFARAAFSSDVRLHLLPLMITLLDRRSRRSRAGTLRSPGCGWSPLSAVENAGRSRQLRRELVHRRSRRRADPMRRRYVECWKVSRAKEHLERGGRDRSDLMLRRDAARRESSSLGGDGFEPTSFSVRERDGIDGRSEVLELMFVLRGGEPTKPARSLGVGRGFGDNGSGLRAVDLGVSEVDHRKGTF
jgi:hypothetical protein